MFIKFYRLFYKEENMKVGGWFVIFSRKEELELGLIGKFKIYFLYL